MIEIDGSYGEGGGQIVRTSLALSLVTGKPFTITHIRSGRKKPGLMRQHLTAVNAAGEIGDAVINGNRIGSTALTFRPRTIKSGEFHFAIGSAGSCTLVLQTVLPALITADGPSEIVLEGGTHNPYAPPFDFLQKSFIPLVNRMGPEMRAALERPGFYPAGGGKFSVSIDPAKHLERLELLNRGKILSQTACAIVSNLPVNIAYRELRTTGKVLSWERDRLKVVEIENAKGPGNVLTIEIESENITEVFTGFGERGISAENVAKKTSKMVREYLKHNAPVGPHLADQLLIPMVLAGCGKFRTVFPTRHTTTNIEIIKRFLDVDICLTEIDTHHWEITIK